MDNISYEDFLKLDIRKGTIIAAEDVPKSKKLLKLTVDFGAELGQRTIMAGIAGTYVSGLMQGTHIVAVLNLEPRKLMGIESHGMLLAAHDASEKVWILNKDIDNMPDGAKIG